MTAIAAAASWILRDRHHALAARNYGLTGSTGNRPEHVHRLDDVLQRDLAHRFEMDTRLAARLLYRRTRDVDGAALGDLLQPDCDVDALAENVAALEDDLAEIHADPEFQPPVGRAVLGAFRDILLRRDRVLDGPDNAVEGHQRAVAGRLDDAAAIARGERAEFVEKRHDARMRSGLVEIDEPAKANDVGRHDRGQPSLHPPLLEGLGLSGLRLEDFAAPGKRTRVGASRLGDKVGWNATAAPEVWTSTGFSNRKNERPRRAGDPDMRHFSGIRSADR